MKPTKLSSGLTRGSILVIVLGLLASLGSASVYAQGPEGLGPSGQERQDLTDPPQKTRALIGSAAAPAASADYTPILNGIRDGIGELVGVAREYVHFVKTHGSSAPVIPRVQAAECHKPKPVVKPAVLRRPVTKRIRRAPSSVCAKPVPKAKPVQKLKPECRPVPPVRTTVAEILRNTSKMPPPSSAELAELKSFARDVAAQQAAMSR